MGPSARLLPDHVRHTGGGRSGRDVVAEQRFSAPTRDYVADISARGAEVRTLDEFFKRLIVVDRKVAVIPASEDHHVALAIHEPSMIAYLVDIFDRAWERAHPFDLSQGADRAVAADVRAMTIRLLKEGHSDPASAKRLGVSSRTYAGYISSLKEEYGVDTRFQLGFAMGRDAGLLAGSGEGPGQPTRPPSRSATCEGATTV